ncbi:MULTISPECIES: SgcJ/EcaC family oxidoreductase [Micromonospora]|uniref:DUF4440 domain-containing protein n=2 Tax=Micromonospora TaxID=1873 RepID=A0A9X0LCS8_9ACTN|nr:MULTISPECIES: SgcJ/EcaC family oxidoreductase [Micromonospora]AEB46066.1 hypothetical protein VAB18032_24840 [Micromonospora maris AB-18-032]AIS85462.1 hypothetical protein VASRM7_224 [Verrucosispora sp. MS100047]KUJ45355.1 hypothetical protein ADL17_19960 [Micromonospora maris]RUL94588.1 SgcJ/EcaC family oxidoreductase [Verrucosispora sp. FIM060022]
MTTVATTTWGSAAALLAATGTREDTDYYRGFTAEDEKAVLTVPMRIQAAWAANDADAFADVFASNGSLLMGDRQLTSREEIRSYMAEAFAGGFRGARVKGWPIEVRFLTADVALVITEGGIIPPGQDQVAPQDLIRATWVVVRRSDGTLELMSHQSSPVRN